MHDKYYTVNNLQTMYCYAFVEIEVGLCKQACKIL